uniref:PASTA domain-containing protein n=1 Tax=candidate division WOR-3 bacterium TaxID=2052148 RepID=A0A7C4CE88_UNCW3
MATVATLADLLRERRLLTHDDLVEVFVPVLEEMEKAHREGRVHGDVKPARIERQPDGSYRLAAYGAGRLGTPRYMSPERVRGEQPDARSDIYSMGAVIFEALTGRPVFTGEVNQEIMQAHVASAPPRPSSIRPGLPAEVDQVILKALAKRREDRFQTAREFAAALVKTMPRVTKGAPEQVPAPVREQKVARPASAEVVRAPAPSNPVPAARRIEPVAVTPARARVNVMVWLLPLVALLLIGLAVFAVRSATTAAVPEVVGLTMADAEAALRGRGLDVARGEEVDDPLPQGMVARQSPAPGERLAKGKAVAVQPSTGLVAVPEVAGVGEAEARVKLRQNGLAVGAVEQQYSDVIASGQVIQTTPRSGTRIKTGSTVTLSIAAGKATCPSCGKRRERGDMFCTRCGYRF